MLQPARRHIEFTDRHGEVVLPGGAGISQLQEARSLAAWRPPAGRRQGEGGGGVR
jgi:hypothetical protein